VYAHKVIVQSERARTAYIRAHKTQFGDSLDRAIGKPDDRFIALGSPKLDKAVNSKKEDFALPDAWSNLIGNKKVILYNSSLGTILSNTEQYLLKIRSVLDTFRKRNDIVLWWRPHPLSDATYKSMRPHVIYEYKKIVADFVREEWGIFDDTPNLHRALAWTDAYYGDISSLVALYECTKKPLMIQSPWIYDDTKDTISFGNLCDDGKYYWFIAFYFNAIFRMDKDTNQIEYVASLPMENPIGILLSSRTTFCNGKIYFAPCSAKYLSIYDIKSNKFSSIKIELPKNYNFSDYFLNLAKFNSSIAYKKWIFLIPYAYPAILRYNTESGDIDYFDDFVPLFQRFLTFEQPFFFPFSMPCTLDNHIFAASYSGNAMLAFNMDTCKSEIYEIGNKDNTYSAICFHDGYLWLMPRKSGPIVKWKPQTSTFEEFPNLPSDFKSDDHSFCALCSANGYLWAFPNFGNMTLKIDPNSGKVERAEVFQQDCKASHNSPPWRFTLAISDGDTIIAYSQARNRFITYNTKTGEYKANAIKLSGKAKTSLMPTLLRALADSGAGRKPKGLLRESSIINLDAFINCLSPSNVPFETAPAHGTIEDAVAPLANQGTAGKAIYRYCVGCLTKIGDRC
jgi:hypothetical protein